MSYSSTILGEANLISYWRLEEQSSTYTDSFGSNPGTVVGGVQRNVSGIPNVGGFGVAVGPPGNYVQVADSASISTALDLTIELWVYVFELGTVVGQFIIGKPGSFAIFMNNSGTLTFSYFSGVASNNLLNSSSNLSAGQWYHLAFTASATGMTIYIDGVSAGSNGTVLGALYDSNNDLYIGPNGVGWSGVIDEVALYSTALSGGTVTTHYNTGWDVDGAPRVAAARQDPSAAQRVQVDFNEPMSATGLTTAGNYTFSPAGPATSSVSVLQTYPFTRVRLVVTGMDPDTGYTVTANTALTDVLGTALSGTDNKAAFRSFYEGQTQSMPPIVANPKVIKATGKHKAVSRTRFLPSDTGTRVVYSMRAFKTNVPTGYVFWQAVDVPDTVGVYAPTSPVNLTDIVIAKVYTADF